jgi:inosose dehydratase
MTNARVAINPLPWILGDLAYRLDEEVLVTAMTELRPIGFDRMTVEMPEGWTAARWGDLVAAHGFAPAPGYYSGDFGDPAAHAGLVEGIRVHAANHAELGLDRAFIADTLVPARIARPAVGADADPGVLPVIADGLAAAAEAAAAEGVRYALHPHVGSRVETEAETRAVLDATAGSALFFGPDTGHLQWAGADPVALIRDYRERVIAVHLKDVDAAAAVAAREAGDDYMSATAGEHVWIEPGRGSVDFDGVFAALGDVDGWAAFDGWYVIEVDVPNAPTAAESSALSWAFLRDRGLV